MATIGARELAVIWRVTEEFRKLQQDMPLQMAAVFLDVCMNEGTTATEIANRLGISQPASTRLLLAFCKGDVRLHGKVREGFGLVEVKEDPLDRRYKRVTLTPAGKRVRDSLTAVVSTYQPRR